MHGIRTHKQKTFSLEGINMLLNGDSCLVLFGVPQGSMLGLVTFFCYKCSPVPTNVKSSIKLYVKTFVQILFPHTINFVTACHGN